MSGRRTRCAIYTRKSTDEGLDQEFNTLDAQREAGEAYIASQKTQGWVCLPARYDDGGFTGGNMDRPALKRLLADVKAGKLDCIVVYKVDRLSRSLLDFARIVQTLEENGVSFVSVTQQFNTSHSMGRLTLNILLSFAQFEREIIAERTSDKMVAARKRGKWTGGPPVLGYDVHPDGGRIIINDDEAEQVRRIFEMYAEKRAMLPVVRELKRRGWHNKRWRTRKGTMSGGKPFNRASVHRLLTNPLYIGKMRCKGEVYPGQHDAIIGQDLWQRVQARLRHNARTGGTGTRNKYGALLKGIIVCGSCDVPMMHSYTHKKGGKRYRYYVCRRAQKHGWQTCPTKSVSAPEIERFVLERIRGIADDPGLVAETMEHARARNGKKIEELEREHARLLREIGGHEKEIRALIDLTARNGDGTTPATRMLAELQEKIQAKQRRATAIREKFEAFHEKAIDEKTVTTALSEFDSVWESLSPREQVRIVTLLVERVTYDGEKGSVAITFRPAGFKTLGEKQNPEKENT